MWQNPSTLSDGNSLTKNSNSNMKVKFEELGKSNPAPSNDTRKSIVATAKDVVRMSAFLPTPTADLKPKDAIKRLGYVHAFGMISVLFVFLAVIYTSQEPYRYMSSNLALQSSLKIPDLTENESLNAHEIWRWLEKVISDIGGHTIDKIEAMCAYSEFNIQTVSIDGKDYHFFDPTQKIKSCSEKNMAHIDGGEKATYLAGSHQLLSFGVFTKRSVPHAPVKGSMKEGSLLHEIPSDDVHSIDPAHDHKVSDVCHVDVKPPTGDFNDTVCVLIDGFKDKIGASLNWPGV
jgi:hypothetical protein